MSLLFTFLLFIFFFSPFAFSQETDSLPKQLPKEVNYGYDMEDAQIKYPIDTGLARFHYYDPVDHIDFIYRNTGALGSASFRMVCCEQQQMGFRMGYEQFNLYRFTESNVPFYKNARPYSQLNLLIGLRREQTANVVHSQNIGKKFNFGFHYLRFATVGTYVNQHTRHNDIAFTTTFDSKKRYILKTMFVHNNVRGEENGGVKETTIYDDTSFVSKELVEVELDNAENRHREISFRVRQSIRNKMSTVIVADTTSGDSTRTSRVVMVPLKWEIYHEFNIGRERYDYVDGNPDSAYYGLFFPDDSNVTEIKSEARKIFTGTKLGVRKNFKQAFIIDVSGSYTLNLVEQDSFQRAEINYADVAISFGSDTGSAFNYGAGATYSLVDYNESDVKAHAFLGYDFGKAGILQAKADYSRVEPGWIFQRFSHGIEWKHELDKQSLLTFEARYRLTKYHFQAAVRFNQVNEFLFFDGNRLPAQHNGSLQTVGFEVRKLFRFNYFGFDNTLYVQLVSDKDFLRYPVYWGVHSLYYERGVFKDKLLTRVGFDIRYNTNYMAPGYFPLTGQFYLQNEEQLSFYPTLDFYVCFKIKTARIFFKVLHLNQGMFKDKGYFNAYKYPATDRTFRFGLSWMFLD